jgi:PAS domain S-box-containing protein
MSMKRLSNGVEIKGHAPWRRARPAWLPYAFAVLAVIAATLLRFWLNPILDDSGFAFYFAAVAIAAWVGGLGPCLVAQVLSLLGSMLFNTDTTPDSWPKVVVGLAAFFFVGIATARLSDATRAAQRRALAQAEEAVQQREQLRTTLACIGDAVIVTDAQGRLTMINRAAESLTGWKAEESIGRPLDAVIRLHDEASGRDDENPFQRAMREGIVMRQASISRDGLGLRSDPLMLAARDGCRIPVDYSAAPIQDGQGQTMGVVLVLRDETERVRAAGALREADRKKDEFLATLGHELRNPLAPIRTGLEVMKMAGDNPALIANVRCTMERQTQQMVRLIDDLLDVSRITRGKLQLRRRQVELAEVMRSAVEAARPFIDEAGHDLTVDIPTEPVCLDADPARLAQVLSNLLHNAAKYTPPKGRIRLAASKRGEEVEITVADNGQGIPAEMQAQIFDMFAQIKRQHDGMTAGLGIGLTLVKSLIELHGGTVSVHSDGPGRGCEFRVRLPVVSSSAPGRPQADDEVPRGGARRRVLIVDDNVAALEMLQTLVAMLGHEVQTARDGVEALQAADAFRPDAVLMDLGMPNMDGYEAARRLRQERWGRNLLLVAVTGWGQEQDRQRTKEIGFDCHLVKPVEAARIQDLLADCRRPTAPSA